MWGALFSKVCGRFSVCIFLKSQIATSSSGWGGRRKAPLVFTEHGVLQAANVLNSTQANKMGVRNRVTWIQFLAEYFQVMSVRYGVDMYQVR